MKDNHRGRITSKDVGVLLGGQQMQNANENDNGRDLKKFYPGNYKNSIPCVGLCMCLYVDEDRLLCITE